MHDAPDANTAPLVDALNDLPGCRVIGACGGHDNPAPGQWLEGSWYVKFRLDHTEDGWRTLEFLAWLINRDGRNRRAFLLPDAPPPHLNDAGHVLSFTIEVGSTDTAEEDAPERWASWIRETTASYYVPVNESSV